MADLIDTLKHHTKILQTKHNQALANPTNNNLTAWSKTTQNMLKFTARL